MFVEHNILRKDFMKFSGLALAAVAMPEWGSKPYDKEKLAENLKEKLSKYPDHGVMVKDLVSGEELLSQDADKRFSPASTIKAVIAYGALKLAEEGKLALDKRVSVSKVYDGSTTPGDAPGGITRKGKIFTLREHINRTLKYSDNTTSNIVLEQVGVERLRLIIKDLGLDSTLIERKYFTKENKPLQTTPRDMVVFLSDIHNQANAGGNAAKELLHYMREGTKERYGRRIDSDLTVAGKYGSNGLQEHQIGLIQDPNGNAFAMAVYADGVPDDNRAISFYAGVFNTFNTAKL